MLKNQDIGRSWNIAGDADEDARQRLHDLKGAYSYGEARNTIDPGSIASGSWTSNAMSGDPNNPGLGYSSELARPSRLPSGARTRRSTSSFGATTVSALLGGADERQHQLRLLGRHERRHRDEQRPDLHPAQHVGDELRAVHGAAARTFTAAEQAAAFEAYIAQDAYLSKHRGEYAERGAVFLPLVTRIDLSLTQDVFHS